MLFSRLTASEVERRSQVRWVAAATALTGLGALAGSAVVGMRRQGDSFLVAWTLTRLVPAVDDTMQPHSASL